MIERKIYLIRHGKTQTDGKKRYIGITDVEMCEEGKLQVRLIRDKLEKVPLDKVFCSNLVRSIETADIICEGRNAAPVVVPKFHEINLGKWENISFEDIKKMYPEQFFLRGKNIGSFIPPLGESFNQCRDRVMKALSEVLKGSSGNILICGHSGVNRCIISSILDISLCNIFKIKQDYGCINTIIEYNGKLKVGSLNCSI